MLFCQVALAQLKVVKLTKANIPASIKYVGHPLEVVKYTDNEGEHLVFTTETGVIGSKKIAGVDDLSEAEVNAYNYMIGTDQPKLIWKVHDFVIPCTVDVTAKFLPQTFAVTDLNNDGKAEVWLMYRTACRGDVSAANMKIIMYQSTKKYAMRGTSKIQISTDPVMYDGGTYAFDDAFKAGPDVFRQYAETLWKKNLLEKFGD